GRAPAYCAPPGRRIEGEPSGIGSRGPDEEAALAAKTRPSALAIAPTAVLLIASAFLIFVSSQRLRTSRDLVFHTYDVIGTARLLSSAIQDAATGERGYVIGQEPEYLQP